MNLEHVQQTFITESRELLREMESALLALERAPLDDEAVNTAFRAVHTIKGSSGVFSFDAIVDFTHATEAVLHDIRAGHTRVTPELTALLLACCDHVGALLDCLVDDEPPAAHERIRADEGRLLARLAASAGGPQRAVPADVQQQVQRLDGTCVTSDTWHISVRFGRDMLRHGMDPLSLLRYLGTLGQIHSVTTLFDGMPPAEDMDPESCYLGLEIDFSGDATKEAIEQVFEYARDDCLLRMLPPHSLVADYAALIEELPEENALLGELLVKSGALTRRELEEGLRLQHAAAPETVPGGMPRLGDILVSQGLVRDEVVQAALQKQDLARRNAALETQFVRVRADKLDEMIALVGELVIASAAADLAAQRSGDGESVEAASTLRRLVEEVRDSTLQLRMVPIAETFGRYRRLVRDLGHELGKEVDLELSGTETELDKSMVEKIRDPLMHLVRNALDHGIESPRLRAEAGKPACGKLRLNAYHESGNIVIEVADDGAGLDRERILRRAVDRGLVPAGQTFADREIHQLVMEPGFSTAAEVTSVSGRGVGLDVVRRNVEALRGSVSLESMPGRGTVVALRLPLTLAIIDGFLVQVGNVSYIVPLERVVECLELEPDDSGPVEDPHYINLRGTVLPLLRLREVFAVAGAPPRRQNVVVVDHGERQVGLIVDALVGEFQTVIKPLGKLFERLGGISGSTILGNGEVALILDVQALVQRAMRREARGARRADEP